MSVHPSLLHPSIRARVGTIARLDDVRLTEAERIYVETLLALDGSLRSPEEMAEAASVLNPMLDARGRLAVAGELDAVSRLDGIAARVLKAAQGARSARSGMGVDLCLDLLRLAYDDARAELGKIG